MGLDMYAFTVDVEVARGGVVDVALGDTATDLLLAKVQCFAWLDGRFVPPKGWL